MEHRLSRRIPLYQDAIVDCPRAGGGPVRIRDMNLGGALVESPLLFLPMHAPLMIAFSLESDEREPDFLFEAMVVRHTPAGAALMFSELETDVLRVLHAALYPKAPAPRRAHWIGEVDSRRLVSAAGR